MPVEPGVVDTNVLVYALDADAPQHAPSRALLEAGRDGFTTLYVEVLQIFGADLLSWPHVARLHHLRPVQVAPI